MRHVVTNHGAYSADIMFTQHFQRTGKELVIATMCLNDYTPIYFCHALTPDAKIMDALFASCLVPGYLTHVRHGDLALIDGAYLDNFPWAFKGEMTLRMRFNPVRFDDTVHSFEDTTSASDAPLVNQHGCAETQDSTTSACRANCFQRVALCVPAARFPCLECTTLWCT